MNKQWRCVLCSTYVDGHDGHLKSWRHLKMLVHNDMEEGGTTRQCHITPESTLFARVPPGTGCPAIWGGGGGGPNPFRGFPCGSTFFHQEIPTPWPWAQQMLRENGWAHDDDLVPGAAAASWLEQQQEDMRRTELFRQRVPGPPPGAGPDVTIEPPPPPPHLPPQQRVAGRIDPDFERLGSEIGVLAGEVERQNSEVAGLQRGMEQLGVQIDEMTKQNAVAINRLIAAERQSSEVAGLQKGMEQLAVQIDEMSKQNAVAINRLIAALEHRDTAAAAGGQTGVPSQSGGDITRRMAYVSSSNEGFLECTRPGSDSSEQPENQASAGQTPRSPQSKKTHTPFSE